MLRSARSGLLQALRRHPCYLWPARANFCQGSPSGNLIRENPHGRPPNPSPLQPQPLANKGDLDMALHSVLQQHFLGDERAETKRVAAEAAMLTKLYGGDQGAVSTGDLNNIFRAAGVQAEQFGVVLKQDSANFCWLSDNRVLVQPAFQQQILARMAEYLQSSPQHNACMTAFFQSSQQQEASPHSQSRHAAAMEYWRAKLRAGAINGNKRPSVPACPDPGITPPPGQSDQESSRMALRSILQHCFVGDERAEVKRLAVEAAMIAEQFGTAVSTGHLHVLYRDAGLPDCTHKNFGHVLFANPHLFSMLGPGSGPVTLQPNFRKHLHACIAKFPSNPLPSPVHPPRVHAAMEALQARLGKSPNSKQTKSPARPAKIVPRHSPARPEPGTTPLPAQPDQEGSDIAVRSILQHCFVGDDKAEIKRLAAEAVLIAEEDGTAVSTNHLHVLYREAGLPREKFVYALFTDARFSVLGQGSGQVVLQPDFHKHLHVRIAEFRSKPLPEHFPDHPPRVNAAMQSLRAWLAGKGFKSKQGSHPAGSVRPPPPAPPTSSPIPQVPQKQHSTQPSAAPSETPDVLEAALPAVPFPHSLPAPPTSSPTPQVPQQQHSTQPSAAPSETPDGLQPALPAVPFPHSLPAAPTSLPTSQVPQQQHSTQTSAAPSDAHAGLRAALSAVLAPRSMAATPTTSSTPQAPQQQHSTQPSAAPSNTPDRLQAALLGSTPPSMKAAPTSLPIPQAPLQQHGTQPPTAPPVGHKALLDQPGTKHQFKEGNVEKSKADPEQRPWQTRPLPAEWTGLKAEEVEHLQFSAQYMMAQANRLARQLNQYQEDSEQAIALGKPPPFVELQLKMGPGFSPTYHPYAKDAQHQGGSSNLSPSEFASASEDHKAESGMDEDAASVIGLLPSRLQEEIKQVLQEQGSSGTPGSTLTEIHVDEGRPVKLRFRDRPAVLLPIKVPVAEALNHLVEMKEHFHLAQGGKQGMQLFGSDGRMALPGMLHRVSGMRDPVGNVYALTYRIGRHQPGLAEIFSDLLAQMCAGRGLQLPGMHSDSEHEVQDQGKGPPINSILIMGPPGCGKTTLLRDMARLLSMELQQEVNVVDTSSEIAGDSFVPHPCIGSARRFFVPDRQQQHRVLIESVQNHGPEVVIVDEIGTKEEVAAVSTISQRGVNMIGTAHGRDLRSLLRNPVLVNLVGGIEAVTLGDEEAKKTNKGDKVRLERRGKPVFSTLIEVLSQITWRIHTNVAESVDIALSVAHGNKSPNTQLRRRSGSTFLVKFETPQAAQQAPGKMEERDL